MKYLYLAIVLFALPLAAWSQEAKPKKEKKVVTIRKSTDKEGNEVIEKKILEGDAATKESDELKSDGRTIRITIDSSGEKEEIIIDNEIRIGEDGDPDQIRILKESRTPYTERTVTVKKNPDGSVEIKEQSGAGLDPRIHIRVDSTEAHKPSIGVMLNEELSISGLVKGGAAEAAGLAKGDVLTHLDGTFIDDYDHLKQMISKKKVGEQVTLTYLRDRKEMKTTLTLKGGSTRIYFNR
ncbi:MAG TPA: PDZ domain-containing protein [Saprospiraceae bacterium]|nr:PDZ domain-containing protein [Saprospiraceae bacterium]HNT20847.1 PDZ domain-containing protein [Saprospiraceae bacterium]